MIKTVIFDFDGTLCNSFEEMMESFTEVCLKYGSTLSETNRKVLREQGARVFLSTLGIEQEKLKTVLDEVRQSMARKTDLLRLFDGMKSLINLKDKGLKMGIISGSPKEYIVDILIHNDANFVDFVIFEDNVFGKDKTILDFIDKNQLEPDEVAYVGDEIRDIEAANKVGTFSVAVTWGYNNESLLSQSQPKKIVRSFEELVGLFN